MGERGQTQNPQGRQQPDAVFHVGYPEQIGVEGAKAVVARINHGNK
jgi:hypothetical protein